VLSLLDLLPLQLSLKYQSLKYQTNTTLFKSVGMALFDLTVARLIYRKALQLGLGQKIEL
jgi:ornithine cyclodeaminase/alanine dehydrogenase-like protein (mu-crystallin family)